MFRETPDFVFLIRDCREGAEAQTKTALRGIGVSVGWWMLSRLLIPDRHEARLIAQKALGGSSRTESYTVSSRTVSCAVLLPLSTNEKSVNSPFHNYVSLLSRTGRPEGEG
jgi:hypothetical protein